MRGPASWVALTVLSLLAGPLFLGWVATVSGPTGALGRSAIVSDARSGAEVMASVPLSSSQQLRFTVALTPRDATGLSSVLRSETGTSQAPYLTEGQFLSLHRPRAANVTAVESYFQRYGATHVSVTKDGLGLSFVLPAGPAEAAFATPLLRSSQSAPTGEYFAERTPSLPVDIAPMVAGVGGLSGVPLSDVRLALSGSEASTGLRTGPNQFITDQAGQGENWYVGSDFAQAYRVSDLFPTGAAPVGNATFPTGEAVATILMSGYNDSAGVNLPPWDPAQVLAYFNDTFPSNWPHPKIVGVPVTVSGVTPPAPGAYPASQNDTSFNEAENSLDLEMAGSAAPGATVANFYFAASLFTSTSSNQTIGNVADDFAQCLASALTYNYGGPRLAAVTNSFGLPDLNDPLWNLELVHAAATGVTVIAASGDQGNAPNDLSGRFQGPWPTWPGSAAFNDSGVVAVGGASVNLTGTATGAYTGGNVPVAFDPTVGGVASQWAWYNTLAGSGNYSGTEGGVSVLYSEPAWQYHSAAQPSIANASALQGVASLGRSEPDVAFPANVTIAYVATNASGIEVNVLQGTSIGSPFFAGWLASAAQVVGHPFGFLDPELYRIASYFAQNPSAASPFLDVSAGGNDVFSAAPGWDATTGWGGVDAVSFLSADSNPAIRNFTYAGPTPGIPPPPPPPKQNPALVPIFAIAGLAVAVAVVLVIVMMRPSPPTSPYGPPPGAYVQPPWVSGPPPPRPWPPPAVSTFACPYCGRPRPAEPGRCPSCGAM